MAKSNAYFRENNSGGSYVLGVRDYEALQAAGFSVDLNAPRFPGDVPVRRADWRTGSAIGAKVAFRKATGRDPNTKGCPCCGPRFDFYPGYDDEEAN